MIDFNFTYSRAQHEIFFNTKEKYLIVTKGRRFGATRGAAQAFIEYMIDGITPLLWVDTINGNIDRYFERYFEPVLKKAGLIKDKDYTFNQQKKEFKFLGSTLDFRSSDNPHNIEGFGYKKIFLNEAGIILADSYLYTNAILPMMIDYPDSQLIAAGVPKGKTKKNGDEHMFYTLFKRGKSGNADFRVLEYTSYDSPFINEKDVAELEKEITAMDAQMIEQEIYGKFIDYQNSNNPFIYNFSKENHTIDNLIYDPRKQLLISVDFNINPITAIFAHSYRDNSGEHLDVISEVAIDNGSVDKLCDYIKVNYRQSLPTLKLTGDAMGRQRNISQRDNASNYDLIKNALKLRSSQIVVNANPTHENSRTDCNYFLANYKNFKINENSCKNLIFDLINVQCDIYGSIIKRNRLDFSQKADFLDNFRYLINTFFIDWIKRDSKLR